MKSYLRILTNIFLTSISLSILLGTFLKIVGPINQSNKINNPANLMTLEDCINDAGSLLLDIEFLMKHTYKAKMTKIKRLLRRAEIKDDEVALIRAIISQARWAIKNKND